MAAIGNKVRFIQFNGTLNEWEQSISNNDWYNAIVFGYIYDEQNDKVLNKIYAGKDTYNVDYIFDFNKDMCRWNYGDVSQGWHDSSTKITNKVGSITTDMTLGDLISATNNGELSRIIEMMLFKNAGPQIITLTALQKEGSEKHAITVSFKALNANECWMKITDNNGKVILNSSISSVYDNVFTQLVPNMTYTVVANASSNDEVVTGNTQVTTQSATQPTVSFDEITCTPNTDNNYYRVSNISLNVTSNDYNIDSTSTWKLGSDDNITLSTLMSKDISYGVSYDIMQHYKGTCVYQYPGETGTAVNFDSDTSIVYMSLPSNHDISILKVNGISITPSTTMPITVSNPSFEMEYGVQPRLNNGSVDVFIDNVSCCTSISLTSGTYKYVYDFTGKSTDNYNLNVSLYDEYGNCCKSNIVTVDYQAAAPEITYFNASIYRYSVATGPTLRSEIDLQAINHNTRQLKITDLSLNRVITPSDWVFVTSNPYYVNGLVPDADYKFESRAFRQTVTDGDTSTIIVRSPNAVDATVTIEDISVDISTNTFAVLDLQLSKANNDYVFDTEYYNAYNVTDDTSVCDNVSKAQFINDCSQLIRGKQYKFRVDCDTSCKYHYSDIAPVMKNISSNEYTYTAPLAIEYLYTQLSHNSSAYYTQISDTISVNGNNAITAVAGSTVANVITAVLDPNYDQGGDIPAGMLLDFIDKAKDVSYYDIRNDSTVTVGSKTYYKHIMDTYSNMAMLMLIPNGYSAELWDSAMGGTAPQTQLAFTKSTNTITVGSRQYYVWYCDQWHSTTTAGGVYFFYVC